jgi:hypothetical protein
MIQSLVQLKLLEILGIDEFSESARVLPFPLALMPNFFFRCVVGSEEKAGEGEGEGKRKCARSNKELWRDFRLHCAHINCLIMR